MGNGSVLSSRLNLSCAARRYLHDTSRRRRPSATERLRLAAYLALRNKQHGFVLRAWSRVCRRLGVYAVRRPVAAFYL